eukprot:397815-Prymnesium_polylepis.1
MPIAAGKHFIPQITLSLSPKCPRDPIVCLPHSTTTNSAKARRPSRRLAPKPMGPSARPVCPMASKARVIHTPHCVEALTAHTDSFTVRQSCALALTRRGPTSYRSITSDRPTYW